MKKTTTITTRRAFTFLAAMRTAVADAVRGVFQRDVPPTRASSPSRRWSELEPLEPRLLLSADLPGTAGSPAEYAVAAPAAVLPVRITWNSAPGSALDASLRLAETDGGQQLQLLDNLSGAILGQQALNADVEITIQGGQLDDALLVDLDTALVKHAVRVTFEGGVGSDTLKGAAGDTAWTVAGRNAGSAGVVTFNDVESLLGASGNQDTFTVTGSGSLSGLLDGGVGGFDTLVLDGGAYSSIVYAATGPDSGTIERDADLLRYAGLEPIFDNASATDRVIRTSNNTDNARLTDLGAQLTLASTDAIPTFESITFIKPTNSLTINLGGDFGIPVISDTDRLDIQALNLSAALIVNGEGGLDEVTISGNLALGANPLAINAEGIIVGGVSVAAGNIAFNAVAAVGSVPAPDALPFANVAAFIRIEGATLTGGNIALNASANLVSSVVNLPTLPAAALVANVSATVAVTGAASIIASGTFTANATSNVVATVTATPTVVPVVGEIATANPVINTTARSNLSDNAQVSAGGAVGIAATTSTVVTSVADGITAVDAIGTTVAAPVVIVTTEAFIEDAAAVTASSSLAVQATAGGTLATTANSTPAGAAVSPDTLAALGIATAAGPQTDAAAIAATTLTSTTRAFLNTSGSIVSTGAVSVFSSSAFTLQTTANATPTINPDNNGFAVATNLTQIVDEAFIDGSPDIQAPALSIRTGGGSSFNALSRSGAAGLDNANPAPVNAGSLALNSNLPSLGAAQGNLSHAYIGANAVVGLSGTDVTIAAANTSVTDLSAEPLGAASIAEELGVGRSVAANVSAYTTLGSIEAGATITGADDLTLTANGDQTTRVTSLAGAVAGVDASAMTIAASVTGHASTALVGAGAVLSVGGSFTAQANHRATSIVRASSNAAAAQAAAPTQSLALPIAVNLANDVALASIAGAVTAVGSITIGADARVQNQAESVAGAQGADAATTSATGLVGDEITFLSNRANLVFGTAPRPPVTDPDIDTGNLLALAGNQTQGKAAAVAANLANAAATAEITATGSATSTGGALTVGATSDVDSNALASASAVLNLLGVAGVVAINAQQSDRVASISGDAQANGITVATAASGDGTQTLAASAVSGTGIQIAGVAGAFSATLALGRSNAFIGSGATLTLGADTDLVVQADMVLVSTADATPLVDAGNTLGVGASIEFNAGVYRTLAEIQDVTIVGADDVSVLAAGDYRTTASAQAGVGADAGVGAAVALLLSDFTTTAQLTNTTNSSTITGGLTVSADHVARATHAADAGVTAADVSAGAAIALGVMQGGARAFAGNRMDVAGAVNVTALTDTVMDADATASSQGVDSDDLLLEFKLDLLLDEAFKALRSAITFDPVTAVDGAANTLSLTGHGLSTGDSVIYGIGDDDDDEQVGALVDTDDYFVRVIDGNTVSLHASRDDALNNVNAIDLEPTADFDNLHTLQPRVPGAVAALISAGRLGTGDGSVGAAAAAAANLDYNSALAGITAGAQITADLPVSVVSTLDADADAFATAEAVDSAVSLGIAAAANITSQGNQAFIGGNVTAPGIEVRARLGGNGVSDFTAEAISGGGSEANLGVAGAFAVNLSSPLLPLNPIVIPIPALPAVPAIPGLPPIVLPTLPPLPTIPVPTGGQQAAVVLDGANLTLLDGRDLLVRSDFIGNYSATTSATPQATAVVGIGPSVSANAITQQSLAEIRDAVVTGTGGGVEFRSDIDVVATGDYTATATATAGASSSISLPAAAALNYSDLNTVARIGNTTSPSAINGNLRVQADHDAVTTHAASTDSGVGGTASLGAALALGYVLGGAEVSSAMDIDVLAGTVAIRADNQSVLDADAVSGQSGAANDPAGNVVTEELEAQVEGLLALAGQGEIPEDVIRILQRASAETADGPIGAAAAVAMNLDFGYSEAALADGSRLATSTAPVVAATGDMDSDALATAASVDAAAGIGVAVAINVDAQRIEGAIGGDITAPAITLQTARSGDGIHRLNATAISGAGAEDVGVAGAFALNLSGDPRDILEGDATGGGQLIARILDGANLTLTDSTDVTVTATYVGDYNATATAVTGGGTLGIGPSVAVNAVVHATIAEIGAAVINGADDVVVSATGTYTADTLAVAGAESDGSLAAAVALTGTQNDTIARVRPGETMSTIDGNLVVTASHTAMANTTADADSGGDEVGLGVAVAAGGPLGGARAEGGPNMTVAGDVTILATTVADANTDAEASQLGALISSFTVDEETQRQLKRLAAIAGVDDILFPFVDPHPPLQAHFNAETEVDGAANTISVTVPHEFDAGDAVVYRNNEDDTSIGGLTDGTTYFVSFATPDRSQLRLHTTRADALAATNAIDVAPAVDAEDHHTLVVARTFAAAAVDSGAETINIGNLAGLSDGDAVKYFNGGGSSVGGLVDGRRYFVNVDAADPAAIRVQLFDTRSDAMAATNAIDLDGAAASGGAHQLVKVVDAYHSLTAAINPASNVDDANNRLNFVPLGLENGDSVVYENNGDDETIAGLTNGCLLYTSDAADE